MLRINLASRPFYNERLVRAALLLVGILALAFTLFNVNQIVSLRGRSRELDGQVAESDARARALRADAQKIRQSLDQQDVSAVQAAARQANQLIDRRAFSWTELFNIFEATLPPNVRITAVQPQVDDSGRMVIAITAVSRGLSDLDSFLLQLQKSGAFSDAFARSERVNDEDGTLESMIQGLYRESTGETPPASESGVAKQSSSSTADAGGPR
jgi:type IV pilus assembly protein PilN